MEFLLILIKPVTMISELLWFLTVTGLFEEEQTDLVTGSSGQQ